tara:strand:+ start:148 stop:579 length:432 start_codon:yes stop_codon:yes gene_type:complete
MGIEASNCCVLKAQIVDNAIQAPRTNEVRVSPASRFQREARAAVARRLHEILTLSLILLSSSELRIRSTPGYEFIEWKPTARKRSLSLADIRAKEAAKKAGIRLRLSPKCTVIATGNDEYSHPISRMAVVIGATNDNKVRNCG